METLIPASGGSETLHRHASALSPRRYLRSTSQTFPAHDRSTVRSQWLPRPGTSCKRQFTTRCKAIAEDLTSEGTQCVEASPGLAVESIGSSRGSLGPGGCMVSAVQAMKVCNVRGRVARLSVQAESLYESVWISKILVWVDGLARKVKKAATGALVPMGVKAVVRTSVSSLCPDIYVWMTASTSQVQ